MNPSVGRAFGRTGCVGLLSSLVVLGTMLFASKISLAQDPQGDVVPAESGPSDGGTTDVLESDALAPSVVTVACGAIQRRTSEARRAVPEISRADAEWDRCYAGPWGAWGIVLDALTLADPDEPDEWLRRNGDLHGRWGVAFVSAAGRGSISFPDPPDNDPRPSEPRRAGFNFYEGTEHHVHLLSRVPFDYDGDGTPEFFVRMAITGEEWGEVSDGNLWTLRSGRPTLYTPASRINVADLDDVDHDGRPDLVTHFPYDLVDVMGFGGGSYSGVTLVAHSLTNGAFSFTDDIGTAAARRACPSRPSPIVARRTRRDHPEPSETAHNVICARIWGVSTADVLSTLDRDRDCSNRRRRRHANTISYCDEARELATIVPPVDPVRVADLAVGRGDP